MKIILMAMMMIISMNAEAFTEPQKKVLDIAYVEGLKIGYPETIQGICMQETLAGVLHKIGDRNKAFGKKSYGIMQVKLDTAKDVIRKFPGVRNEYPFLKSSYFSDEGLLIQLVENGRFNIRIGSLYFKMLSDRFKKVNKKWTRSVLAYNRGPHGKGDPNDYVRKVKKHILKIRKLNLRYSKHE